MRRFSKQFMPKRVKGEEVEIEAPATPTGTLEIGGVWKIGKEGEGWQPYADEVGCREAAAG